VAGAFDKEWTELSKSGPTSQTPPMSHLAQSQTDRCTGGLCAEKKNAVRLGYTADSWYDNAPPKLVPWASLSKGLQKSAKKLGWDEELWDNELETATKGDL